MDVPTRKDTIRRLVLARRRRLTAEERAAASAAITDRVTALPEYSAAASVLASVSMRSEVSTRGLIERIVGDGKRLLIPWVADDGSLRASEVGSLEDLEPGYRGIPEPRTRLPIEASAAELVVVPGVAFDLRGGRLGYGGGFFDGFLRSSGSRPRIALCFELQLVDEVPREGHDEPVDVIVTEEQVVRVPRPA